MQVSAVAMGPCSVCYIISHESSVDAIPSTQEEGHEQHGGPQVLRQWERIRMIYTVILLAVFFF